MLKQRIRTMNNKLKGYRVWKNITQKELSEELNISRDWIRRIENDKAYPKYQIRKKLCDYFGINQEQLFILDQKEDDIND
ncbi:MAG: helix-turn-helix transcriptional regulator [Ignavibacteria bacterium]|jgi:DNA-binding XRE family transcriptional regulator